MPSKVERTTKKIAFTLQGKIILLSALVAVFSALLVASFSGYNAHHMAKIHAEQKLMDAQNLILDKLDSEFSQMATDLVIMSRMRALTSVVERSEPEGGGVLITPELRSRIENTFTLLMLERPDYFQLRLISADETGKELVRVERRGTRTVAVKPDRLQPKGAEPYMIMARSMTYGDVRFSDVSLNREHGKVDLTQTPTIRIVTPLFNEQGDRFAALVINADYRQLLKRTITKANPEFNVLIVDQLSHTARFDHLTNSHQFSLNGNLSGETNLLLSVLDTPGNGNFSFPGPYVALRSEFSATDKAGGLNFRIILYEQKSVVFGAVQQTLVQGVLVAIILGILAAAVAAFLSARLMNPLREVSEKLSTFSVEDDIEVLDLPVARKDEVGSLAQSFRTLLGEMHNARELKRNLVKNAADGLLVVDKSGKIQIFNPACEKMFGRLASEVIGEDLGILMQSDLRERHISHLRSWKNFEFRQIMAKGREIYAQHSNGDAFPIEISISQFVQNGELMFSAIIRDLSHVKKAEKDQVRQKEMLALALEGGGLGLWDWNILTGKVIFSDRWAEMLGYDLEELAPIFGTWERLVEAEDLLKTTKTMDDFVSGKSAKYEAEFRMRHKEGHTIWVQASGKVFERDMDGNPTRIVGTHTDISDHKRKELSIREQNRQLELAEKVSNIGHWSLNADTGETTWSEGIYKIHGVDPETFNPHIESGIDFYHPDDRPIVDAAVSEAIETGKPFSFQLRVVRPDGAIRYVVSKGEVIKDPQRKTGRQVFGVFQDVTDKVISTRRLEESEAKQRTVLSTIADGVVTVDENGKIDGCNPACAKLFGYESDELIGKELIILIPEEHRSAHIAGMKRFAQTLESSLMGKSIELKGLRKNGELFDLEMALSYSKIAGNLLVTGVLRDITERKQTEAMKSEFVSTVNHELRTPLTSIYGSLDMLQRLSEGQLNSKCSRLLTLAHDGCGRLTHLVNDILDVEKIAAGKMEYRFEQLEFNALVKDIIDRHEPLAERFGTRFVLAQECNDLMVNLDPSRFNQALVNLMSNAAKFSPQGEPVTIVTRILNDSMVRVSVRDHGPGIPESFQKRLFERFAQADSSDTRKAQGTGLGLNITKSIVEAFSGEISYETAENKGTVFHIDLPIQDALRDSISA